MIDISKLTGQVLESHKDQADDVKVWLDKLYKSFDAAERSLVRNFYSFYFLWVIGFALGSGFVLDASVSGIKVREIQLLLVGIPPLLGITYYRMSLANTAGLLIESAIAQWYKRSLPKVHETDLMKLTLTPSFTIIERFISGKSTSGIASWLSRLWLGVATMTVFGLPIAGLTHVSVLLWCSGSCPVWIAGASIGLGACLLLRGVILITTLPD